MAGFKLHFTYLEGHQWQLRTRCNFSTHHHSSLPWKTNTFPSLHSLPKKLRCQETRWQLDDPKETTRNHITASQSQSRSLLGYVIVTKPQPLRKRAHYVPLYLSGCRRSTTSCWCSGKGNVVMRQKGLERTTTFQGLIGGRGWGAGGENVITWRWVKSH